MLHVLLLHVQDPSLGPSPEPHLLHAPLVVLLRVNALIRLALALDPLLMLPQTAPLSLHVDLSSVLAVAVPTISTIALQRLQPNVRLSWLNDVALTIVNPPPIALLPMLRDLNPLSLLLLRVQPLVRIQLLHLL